MRNIAIVEDEDEAAGVLGGFIEKFSVETGQQFNVRDGISIYDTRMDTGNKLLNVLVTEKSLYCEQNGITLSCMIDGEKLDFIEGERPVLFFRQSHRQRA